MIFYRWLYSKKSEEAEIDVGSYMFVMIKTNTKVFCKYNIENLTKGWTGGSYLFLRSKPMVHRFRPQTYIGCKYNVQKVPYFFVTEYEGSTKSVIIYISK